MGQPIRLLLSAAVALVVPAVHSLDLRLLPLTDANAPRRFEINGALGQQVHLEASRNLTNWMLVAATNSPSASVALEDSQAPYFAQRFYRARLNPPVDAPKTVAPVLEPGQGATAVITTNGGSLSLTDSNGSTYQLNLPPGALAETETITMRPVAALPGVALTGGLQAMVDLEPDGLQLLRPATLTITPARQLQLAQFIPVTYYDGHEVTLGISTLQNGKVQFPISHFSGYGFGHGSMQDLANLQRRNPPKNFKDAAQKVADYLTQMTREGRGSPGPYDQAMLETLVRDIYDDVLLPNAKASLKNDFILICNVAEFVRWVGLLQGGIADIDHFQRELKEAPAIYVQAARNALDRALQRCLTSNDAKEGLRFYRYFYTFVGYQQGGIEGFRDENFYDSWGQYLPRFQKYFRFELDFESRIEFHTDTTQIFHVRADKLEIKPDNQPWFRYGMKGSGPLNYLEFTFPSNDPMCQIITGKQDSTMNVLALRFPTKRKSYLCPDDQDPGFDVDLYITLGEPTETITANCFGQSFTTQQHLFQDIFTAAHADGTQAAGSLLMTNWNFAPQSRIVARKSVNRPIEVDGGSATEVTEFTLWHAPKP
ncbi:MAG TPA: hypothetical protein VEH27_15625 [Methylomirabilota bacterium]|nr:hypothetical protein [Methylomirabilota bacterium]